MRFFRFGRRTILLSLAPLALTAFLAGCATIPKEVLDTDPASLLETAPQVYVRLSGTALRDIARGMDEEELGILALAVSRESGNEKEAPAPSSLQETGAGSTGMKTSMLKGFLAKTGTFGAGIRGIGTSAPAMEAVLIGDFPVISLRLALAVDGYWKKTEAGGFRSVKYPIFLRPPQEGIIHASTESVPPPRSLSPVEAYPRRFSGLSGSDIFISVNTPGAFFAGSLPLEASSIPLGSIIVSGRRIEPDLTVPGGTQGTSVPGTPAPEARYLLDVHILMKDEATAKAYKPVVKFLWTAAAGRIFGGFLDLSAAPLVLENDVYTVRGIEADAAELRAMITAPMLGY